MIDLLIGINTIKEFNIGTQLNYNKWELGSVISEATESSSDTRISAYIGRKFNINGQTYSSLRFGIVEQIRGMNRNSKFIQGAVGNEQLEIYIKHEDNKNSLGLQIKL